MKYVIIGTAGHIDHGKTELIRALTGIDTDRLKEEKRRGISIDIGFAHLKVSDDIFAGIIDVPGHEKFVKNMLAGAPGFDLVLLVIAADEGIKAQTREHMEIIDLLEVKQGIVVITKTDIVDQQMLDVVYKLVREELEGTRFGKFPVVSVSSKTGQGIEDLKELIGRQARNVVQKDQTIPFRLPIDRIFTRRGFGTVVTGTLFSGKISTGDTVELLPAQRKLRVRNIQVHGKEVKQAFAGERVALNIPDLKISEAVRGCVLAEPGFLKPSYRFDVKLKVIKGLEKNVKNRQRVRFYVGSGEFIGRLRILDREEIKPGDEAWVQIITDRRLACSRYDYFVIRNYSPVYNLGGGRIVDSAPPRHKRFNKETIKLLELKAEGSAEDQVLEILKMNPNIFMSPEDLRTVTGMDLSRIEEVFQKDGFRERVWLFPVGKVTFAVRRDKFEEWSSRVKEILMDYHKKNPYAYGMRREELREKLGKHIETKLFNLVIERLLKDRVLKIKKNRLRAFEYKNELAEDDLKLKEKIRALYERSRFQPPDHIGLSERFGVDKAKINLLLGIMEDRNELVKVSENLYFSVSAVEEADKLIRDHFKTEETLNIAQFRDKISATRKYALPLLQYFDTVGLTRRVGDIRKLAENKE